MTMREEYDRDVANKSCMACDIHSDDESGCFMLPSCGIESRYFQPMGFEKYDRLHGSTECSITSAAPGPVEERLKRDAQLGLGMGEGTFRALLEEQIETCKRVLGAKSDEYGPTDRLHNFRVAAGMECITMEQALAGMMAKHTISVYDMCRESGEKEFPIELWQEKITDHINYLLLLNAAVREREALRHAE